MNYIFCLMWFSEEGIPRSGKDANRRYCFCCHDPCMPPSGLDDWEWMTDIDFQELGGYSDLLMRVY